MKIDKRICDVCGEEITEAHPLRLAVQIYTVTESEKWNGHKVTNKGYKNSNTYDICNKCATYLPNLLRGLQNEKDCK